MSNNYYWVSKPMCECCKRAYEPIHVGKDSRGWCFQLRVYPKDGINTLADWERLLATPGSFVEDEYGRQIASKELLEDIKVRSGSLAEHTPLAPYMERTVARGPNGLLRSAVDGERCVGHGDGPWDYIAVEFS